MSPRRSPGKSKGAKESLLRAEKKRERAWDQIAKASAAADEQMTTCKKQKSADARTDNLQEIYDYYYDYYCDYYKNNFANDNLQEAVNLQSSNEKCEGQRTDETVVVVGDNDKDWEWDFGV